MNPSQNQCAQNEVGLGLCLPLVQFLGEIPRERLCTYGLPLHLLVTTFVGGNRKSQIAISNFDEERQRALEITLKARSSSQPEPYSVVFTWDDKILTVHCSCPAGELGQLCKHKTALLRGDSSMLFDANQGSQLDKVSGWVNSTSWHSLMNELHEAEKETEQTIAKAKKELSTMKHKIGRLLSEGVK